MILLAVVIEAFEDILLKIYQRRITLLYLIIIIKINEKFKIHYK